MNGLQLAHNSSKAVAPISATLSLQEIVWRWYQVSFLQAITHNMKP